MHNLKVKFFLKENTRCHDLLNHIFYMFAGAHKETSVRTFCPFALIKSRWLLEAVEL